MEKKQSLAERLAERLEIPVEALPGVTRLTLTGDSALLIENHHGILEYGETHMAVSGGRLKISVAGDALTLDCMTKKDLRICGVICSVNLE